MRTTTSSDAPRVVKKTTIEEVITEAPAGGSRTNLEIEGQGSSGKMDGCMVCCGVDVGTKLDDCLCPDYGSCDCSKCCTCCPKNRCCCCCKETCCINRCCKHLGTCCGSCFRKTPIFTVMTLILMVVTIILLHKYYKDFQETLLPIIDLTQIEGLIETLGILILILNIVNALVTIQAFLSKEYVLESWCKMRTDGLTTFCHCFGQTVHKACLWFCFVAAYLSCLTAVFIAMIGALFPVFTGLCYAVCTPIYDGKATLAGETTLEDILHVLQTAKDRGLIFKVDVNVHTISDEDTLQYCEVFEQNIGKSGYFFVWIILLVVLQINFTIISRGNLVEFLSHEKSEGKLLEQRKTLTMQHSHPTHI